MILTPDGHRYVALAVGLRVPRPFNLRWLIPKLCGRSERRWKISTIAGVLAGAVGTALLAPTWQTALAAALIFAALPMNRFNLLTPVLVDAPALAFAVLAAVAWSEGLWWLGILLALASGATKETGPVFAALYAWTPWLLIGLLAPFVRGLFATPGPDVIDKPYADQPEVVALCHRSTEHPLRTGWQIHRKMIWSPVMVLPWGGALVALTNLDLQLGVLLAVAYAQLLVATDTVRLYQWAAPLMCVAAAGAVPVAWLPVLVVLTVWNPYAGNGV